MAGADFDSVGMPQEFEFDTAEDFTLVVPTDRLFEIFAVALVWGASGNAGNRAIRVRIAGRNANLLFSRRARLTQIANESIAYVWAPGMPDETAVNPDDQLLQPMPLFQIEEGGSVVIDDAAGIDATDTLVGSISARVYKGE